MMHHDACPLCSGTGITRLYACTDYFVSSEEFSICRCGSCGFIFTGDHPDEDSIGKYYESEDYISHSDTSRGLANKLYHIARGFMLSRKASMVKGVTGIGHGHLLDIGSGTGHFAAEMKKKGWYVSAIEPGGKARSFSQSHFGLNVIDPSEINTLVPGSFDCITLWHVLEHFQDPFGYMSEIYRLLKPEGRCIIAIPNCNSADAVYYKEYWAAWDVPRHLWHFSPDTFRKFIGKTGFSLIKMKRLPLDVFYISMMSRKYKGEKFSFIRGVLHGIWFTFLSLLKIERTSSLVYILKKNR